MLGNKKIEFDVLSKAFEKVQGELESIGLWKEGEYLWEIDLVQSPLPSIYGELGYVFDSGVDWFSRFVGYEENVIYIPSYAPVELYVPGGTLVDTIRHEYGHAWACLDKRFFKKKWFKEAFGRDYWSEWELGEDLYTRVFKNYDEEDFVKSPYYSEFVSAYALSAPYEDFAETFMFYLRYKNSLGRFRKRAGVYKKLMAVKRAVEIKRQLLK